MELKKAWKWIFPLTEVSAREGDLPLSDPAWVMAKNPWWQFLVDISTIEKDRCLVWESLPVRAEDAGKCADIHLSLGEQTHCETNSSFPTDSCVQSTRCFTGDGDRGASAQSDNVIGRGADEGDAKANRMKFEGGGEIAATF